MVPRVSRRHWEQFRSWPAGPRQAALAALDSALAAARTPLVRERITFIRNGYLPGHYLAEAHEAIYRIDPGSADLEGEIRRVSALYNRAMTEFHVVIEPDPTYPSPYYRTYRPYERFKWQKYDTITRMDELLVGKPELRQRLLLSDPVLGEMLSTHNNRRMLGHMRYFREKAKQKGMVPLYLPER